MAKAGFKEIRTDDEFKNIVESESRLLIIDLYDDWYGPCSQMEATFKSLDASTDFFEKRGQFLQMEIKMVPELSAKYADKPRSKACFLFYSGGKVVGEVLGCDAPSIMRTIEEHLPVYTPEEE